MVECGADPRRSKGQENRFVVRLFLTKMASAFSWPINTTEPDFRYSVPLFLKTSENIAASTALPHR